METSIFYYYLAAVLVAAIVFYVIIRAIDFAFQEWHCNNDAARNAVTDFRRMHMAKAAIRCFNDGQRMMGKELIKGINDGLVKMYKDMQDL